jgi:hypothetical protein
MGGLEWFVRRQDEVSVSWNCSGNDLGSYYTVRRVHALVTVSPMHLHHMDTLDIDICAQVQYWAPCELNKQPEHKCHSLWERFEHPFSHCQSIEGLVCVADKQLTIGVFADCWDRVVPDAFHWALNEWVDVPPKTDGTHSRRMLPMCTIGKTQCCASWFVKVRILCIGRWWGCMLMISWWAMMLRRNMSRAWDLSPAVIQRRCVASGIGLKIMHALQNWTSSHKDETMQMQITITGKPNAWCKTQEHSGWNDVYDSVML